MIIGDIKSQYFSVHVNGVIGKTYAEFGKEPSRLTHLAELRFAKPTNGPHEGQLMLVDVVKFGAWEKPSIESCLGYDFIEDAKAALQSWLDEAQG